MSILTLSYIEAPLVKGKRLFRRKEEVGLIRNEDFYKFRTLYRQTSDACVTLPIEEPPIQLHPSQYSISKPLDVDQVAKDIGRAAKDAADAINEFNEAFKNSTWTAGEVDSNDQ